MSASRRACWSEMYVVIRFSRASVGRCRPSYPGSRRLHQTEIEAWTKRRLSAGAERPGARRGGELVGAEILDVAAEAHRVARAGAQALARLDLKLAARAQLDGRLDLVA